MCVVYIQIYINICGQRLCLGSHNLGTFYARKLDFGMTDLNLQFYARVAPGSCPGIGIEVKMYNRSD